MALIDEINAISFDEPEQQRPLSPVEEQLSRLDFGPRQQAQRPAFQNIERGSDQLLTQEEFISDVLNYAPNYESDQLAEDYESYYQKALRKAGYAESVVIGRSRAVKAQFPDQYQRVFEQYNPPEPKPQSETEPERTAWTAFKRGVEGMGIAFGTAQLLIGDALGLDNDEFQQELESTIERFNAGSDPNLARLVEKLEDIDGLGSTLDTIGSLTGEDAQSVFHLLIEQIPGLVGGGGAAGIAVRQGLKKSSINFGKNAVRSSVGVGVATGSTVAAGLGQNIAGQYDRTGNLELAVRDGTLATLAEVPFAAIGGGVGARLGGLGNFALQPTVGVAGEAAASLSVGEDISKGELILAGTLEGITGGIEVAGAKLTGRDGPDADDGDEGGSGLTLKEDETRADDRNEDGEVPLDRSDEPAPNAPERPGNPVNDLDAVMAGTNAPVNARPQDRSQQPGFVPAEQPLADQPAQQEGFSFTNDDEPSVLQQAEEAEASLPPVNPFTGEDTRAPDNTASNVDALPDQPAAPQPTDNDIQQGQLLRAADEAGIETEGKSSDQIQNEINRQHYATVAEQEPARTEDAGDGEPRILSEQESTRPDEPDTATEPAILQSAVDAFVAQFPGLRGIAIDIKDFGEASNSRGRFRHSRTAIELNSRKLTADTVIGTLRHEALVHYGLGALPVNVRQEILNRIDTATKSNSEIKERWDAISNSYGGKKDIADLLIAEEFLASVANNPFTDSSADGSATLARQIYDLVLDALSEIGLVDKARRSSELTSEELNTYIELVGAALADNIRPEIRKEFVSLDTGVQVRFDQESIDASRAPDVVDSRAEPDDLTVDALDIDLGSKARAAAARLKQERVERLPTGSQIRDFGRALFKDDQDSLLQERSKLVRQYERGFKVNAGNDKAIANQIRSRDDQLEGVRFLVEENTQRFNHSLKNSFGRELNDQELIEVDRFLHGEISRLTDDQKTVLKFYRQEIDDHSTTIQRQLISQLETAISSYSPARQEGIRLAFMIEAGQPIPPLSTDQKLQVDKGIPKNIKDAHTLIRNIQSSKGRYLTRSYELFTNKKWAAHAKREKLDEAAVESLVRQGEDRGRAKAEVDRILNKDEGITDVLYRRRKFTPEMLAMMGEIKDPRFNYAHSMIKMKSLIVDNKHYDALAAIGEAIGIFSPVIDGKVRHKYNGGRSSDKGRRNESSQNEEFLLDEANDPGEKNESERVSRLRLNPYGRLGELYMTEDVKLAMEALGELEPLQNGLYKTIIQAAGITKVNLTVAAPTTSFRNAIAGNLLLAAMGHLTPFNNPIKNGKKLFDSKSRSVGLGRLKKATRSKEFATAWRLDLIEKGIIGQGVNANDIRATLQAWDSASNVSRFDGRQRGPLKRMLGVMQRAYAMGDDFYKIMAYEAERQAFIDLGWTEVDAEAKAAERVKGGMPNYSMLPQNIKKLRRVPTNATFVSFPWETVRTTKNNLKYIAEDFRAGRTQMAAKRLAGQITVTAAAPALGVMSMLNEGISEEDDRKIGEMGPKWDKNSVRYYTGMGKNGPTYINMTPYFPAEYLTSGLRAAIRGEDPTDAFMEGAAQYLAPFWGQDITAQTLVNISENRDEFGRKIVNEDAEGNAEPFTQEGAAALTMYLLKTVGPGFGRNMLDFVRSVEPEIADDMTSQSWLQEIQEAAGGKVSSSGKVYTFKNAWLGLVGFKSYEVDPLTQLGFKAKQLKAFQTQASSDFSRSVKSVNLMSKEALDREAERLVRRRHEAYLDMEKYLGYVRSLQVSDNSDQDIINELQGPGSFSKRDIRSLMAGNMPRYRLRKDFMDAGKRQAERAYRGQPVARARAFAELAKRQQYLKLAIKRAEDEQYSR